MLYFQLMLPKQNYMLLQYSTKDQSGHVEIHSALHLGTHHLDQELIL